MYLKLNYRGAHRLGTFPRSSSLALRIRTGTPASSAARDPFSKSAELGVAGGSASAAAATATTAAPTRAFRRASGTLAHAEEPDDDDAALELLGAEAHLVAGTPAARAEMDWARELLYSRAGTIYSGSSEIQRNIISKRVLRLPTA